MLRPEDRIEVRGNFVALCTERGKYVQGSKREGHNVFTTTGRDWLAHLVPWATIGTPDVAYTQRRLRWMGVGIGTQLEVEGVTSLDTPTLATATEYLVPLQFASFPEPKAMTVIKIFGPTEISHSGFGPIPVTEAGLFVDVFPASTFGGTEDGDLLPTIDTTLNPIVAANAPVAYKTFEAINKTADFNLEIRWTFRF